jgi:hypothetical protein
VNEKCTSRPSLVCVPTQTESSTGSTWREGFQEERGFIQAGEQLAARLEVMQGTLGDVVQALAGQPAGAQTGFDHPSGSFGFIET